MVLISRFDETPLSQRWRLSRRHPYLPGVIVKSYLWLDLSGAERIPQKSIIRSVYRKRMMEYWRTLDPSYRERAERMYKYVKSPDPE